MIDEDSFSRLHTSFSGCRSAFAGGVFTPVYNDAEMISHLSSLEASTIWLVLIKYIWVEKTETGRN